MRKLLGLESLPCATTAITGITLTLVRLTATTALTTLWAGSLSALAHGSMASTVLATVADFMAAATMDTDTTAVAITVAVAAIMAGAITVAVVMAMAVVADMGPAATEVVTVHSTAEADSVGALVDSTAVEVPTVGPVDSTAVVGADSMAAVAMAADTGKLPEFFC